MLQKLKDKKALHKLQKSVFTWRSAVVCTEVLTVILLLLMFAFVLTLWAITKSPVEIGFAKSYVEKALRNPDKGIYGTMDRLVAHWPDLTGPLYLGLEGTQVLSDDGDTILSIDSVDIALSKAKLLIGKIEPEIVRLNKPVLKVVRTQDNNFTIGYSPDKPNEITSEDLSSENTSSEDLNQKNQVNSDPEGYTQGPEEYHAEDQKAATKIDGRTDEQTELTTRIFRYIAKPGHEPEENSPLASLKGFEIHQARLAVEDEVLGMTWQIPRFDIALMSTKVGVETDAYIELVEDSGNKAVFKGGFDMIWNTKDVEAHLEFQNISLSQLAAKIPELNILDNQNIHLDGSVQASLDGDFNPKSGKAFLNSSRGVVQIDELSLEPVPYKDFVLQAFYDQKDHKLDISKFSITVKDVSIEANANLAQMNESDLEKLQKSSELDLKESAESVESKELAEIKAPQESTLEDNLPLEDKGEVLVKGSKNSNFAQILTGYQGPINIEIKDLPQKNIAPIWPEALKDDNSRYWVVENIFGGTYNFASANMDLVAWKDSNGEWDVDAKNIKAEFAFEDMSVNYRSPLAPVTHAKGKGRFDYDKETLFVDIESAKINDLELPSGTVELTNIIKKGAGRAIIKANILGDVRSVLEYASNDPISLDKKIDFDIQKTKGLADLSVEVSLPTVADVKMEDVLIDIQGSVQDAFVPDVLQGLDLHGGPLQVVVSNESAQVSGKAQLSNRDIDFTWMEYLESEGKDYTGKIKAKISADTQLREHFGIVLDEFLSGSVPIDVEYISYHDKTAKAFINANIKPSSLYFEPFDYAKKPGQEGSAEFVANFKDGILKDVSDLTAKAPDFLLENSSLTFRQNIEVTELSGGTISRFTLGETVAEVEFQITQQGVVKLAMNGPFLDLRSFLNKEKIGPKPSYNDPPLIASVSVDQMRTAEGEIAQYGKIYIDVNEQGQINQLEMDAVIGKGDIYLRYKPDDTGMRVFRLEADDAGATLKAFKLYENIVGGTLVVYAKPIRGVFDRNLIGKAEMKDFKAVKAPALAQLLGVLSLQGIADLLGDEGISFSKLEAEFDWLYRPQGSLLILKEGRTSGGSLGLTFDGVFDKGEGVVDVSGTIVPMSALNDVLGAIPLIGDILTGGSGGVFAATYTMKGSAEKPEVSVNPLSVLAPGIVRRILFE